MFAASLLLVMGVSTACAQAESELEELRAEISALKDKQAATQKELTQLKATLQPILSQLPQPFEPQDVSLAGSPVLGSDKAKLTVVEFSDLQCPFCVRFYENTYPDIVRDYVETGKVRYVAREFPLTSIHKQAQRASQAALCAGQQEKYWEMRAQIFVNRESLDDASLASYAEKAGVEMAPWRACLESDAYNKKVDQDRRDGANLGIRGTPAFVVGLTDPNDLSKFRALELVEGAHPLETFRKTFDALLSE